MNRAYARSIDLLPTMADVLNVRIPWRTDGRSAFGPAARARRVVRMYRRPLNGTVSIGARAFERTRAAVIRRNNALFGHGNDQPGLYGHRPEPRAARPLPGELDAADRGSLSAALNEEGALRSVELRSGFIPALVTGYVRGGKAARSATSRSR